MGDNNLTPLQRRADRAAVAAAYQRLPPTCDVVRGILDEMIPEIMQSLDIPEHDIAVVDAAISRAFLAIRDNVTNVFRDEQIQLLTRLAKLAGTASLFETEVSVD